jgi:hypothetical protein
MAAKAPACGFADPPPSVCSVSDRPASRVAAVCGTGVARRSAGAVRLAVQDAGFLLVELGLA